MGVLALYSDTQPPGTARHRRAPTPFIRLLSIRQPGPSWPFTSGVYGCLFLVLSWLLLVLKGFSWHIHEGKAAWGPDRASRGFMRLRPHLSSPRGVVGRRCPG